MENYFRTQTGDTMSIQAAVTRGFIYRGTDGGAVVIGGTKMKASAAIDAGLIDQKAADYIASLQGTNEPAPAIREDHAAPVQEPEPLQTSTAVIEALGDFFTKPNALTIKKAADALQAHLKAAKGTKE